MYKFHVYSPNHEYLGRFYHPYDMNLRLWVGRVVNNFEWAIIDEQERLVQYMGEAVIIKRMTEKEIL